MNLNDKCIKDMTTHWTEELKDTILFMDKITYDKKTKNLDMKNLRLSSMAMADSKYSSLTAWDLDPESYKTTIVKKTNLTRAHQAHAQERKNSQQTMP